MAYGLACDSAMACEMGCDLAYVMEYGSATAYGTACAKAYG